ncbi:MAG: hypothetical protein IPN11_05975 [Opitutaceae bacterium]|nr:hypothetical protein [Opitutaceae bacterium]
MRPLLQISLLLACAGLHAGTPAPAPDPLEAGFRQPPPEARPKTWWHWMNEAVTKEGITADLEAMSHAGIGGVQIFYAALRNEDTERFITPSAAYLSPEWFDLIRHTATEAQRLGLDVGFLNNAGCSVSGGPGVTPDQGMQHVVWSETRVTGDTRFTGTVPRPAVRYGFLNDPGAPTPPKSFFGIEPANLAEHYRDIAVIAFPMPPAEADADPVPLRITTSAPVANPAVLCDRDGNSSITLPNPTPSKPVWIAYEFAAPVTVRSVFLACTGNNWPQAGELQYGDDGATWRTVQPLARITLWDRFAPCTTALPETRARHFRFVFTSAMAFARQLQPAELHLSSRARLDHWEIQTAVVPALVPAAEPVPVSPTAAIDPDRLLDLTDRLRPDGTLDWTVPTGDWTILRLGHAPMGLKNRSGSMAGSGGLEVDKLDRAAVEQFFADGPAKIIAAAGPLAGPVLNNLLMDSWEMFTQNWTPRFAGEFARRRGYDPRRWLPVMTGRIVGDAKSSTRFLFDVRRTISELVVENHYGTFAELAHRAGLKLYAEAPGHAGPTVVDAFATKGRVDVPMGEFWLGRLHDSSDAKQAAASAQLYGQRIVAAESFTSSPEECNWQESPATLKSFGDHYFAAGINQFILHTSVHQPWPDRVPGLTLLMYGSHFERTNGWLEVAGPPWLRYIARCQFLLQRGLPVADVNFFVGEDTPNDLPGPDDARLRAILPAGYDYGGCSAEGLLQRMQVRDGRIVLPDGMSYAVLVLPDWPELTLPVTRKLRDLVAAGATVYGPRPIGSPSLGEHPRDESEVRRIGGEVWGAVDGVQVTENRFGLGRVVWGRPLASILDVRDFDYDRSTGANLDCIHRRDGDTEIYFISNQGPAAVNVSASFRVSGKAPALWDAETGEITQVSSYVQHDGRTTLPLHLSTLGSVFVVFRHPASPEAVVAVTRDGKPVPLTALHEPAAGAYVLTTAAGREHRRIVPVSPTPLSLTGPWTVHFPTEPQPFRGNALTSWSDHSEAAIRFFSGTATYSVGFDVPAEGLTTGQRAILDLGRVEKFAGITLNGRPLRLLWHPPYVIDVTGTIRPGRNTLEIAVTNLLVNRLIGDQHLPKPDRRTWSTHEPYTKDSPLLPSGLLGPVRVKFQSQL